MPPSPPPASRWLASALAILPALVTLFLSTASLFANSYVSGPPLEKAPAPNDILAFATDPPPPRIRQTPPLEPDRALLEKDFLRFLQEGIIQTDLDADFGGSDGSYCTGYFFTKEGTPYRWALLNRHLLSIRAGQRSCLIRLKDSAVKSIPVFLDADTPVPPLARPPREADLFAFVTDLQPGTGGAVPLSEKNLRHFLREGTHVIPKTRSEINDLASRQRLTLSPERTERYSKFIPPTNGTYSLFNDDIHCEGALVTNDRKIYVWNLLGDTALELTTPEGNKCLLLLPDASPIDPP